MDVRLAGRWPYTMLGIGTIVLACVGLVPLSRGCARQEASPVTNEQRERERSHMVAQHIVPSGVRDPLVLAAMRRVPRHAFVAEEYAELAYLDEPLPIGHGQTISQPSLVAYMTELLRLRGSEKVLEVGTGSGYQAAVLAEVVPHVFTIEIVEPLARRAEGTLRRLGYDNVTIKVGDGYAGWNEEAPFDAILVTAAAPDIPQPLLDQLAIGGRLVVPVGRYVQNLVVVTRTADGYERISRGFVRFVPMTGKAEVANGRD